MNELQIYDSNSLGDLAFVEVDRLTPDYYVEHFQEFLPQYISHGNPSADTLINYVHEIKNFLNWCIGHRAHPLALKNKSSDAKTLTEKMMNRFNFWKFFAEKKSVAQIKYNEHFKNPWRFIRGFFFDLRKKILHIQCK